MVKKVKRILKIDRFTALADKGYYNGKDLLRVKKQKVTAIVAKQKASDSKEIKKEFHTDKFKYDETTDMYTCPNGQILKTTNKKKAKRRNYFNKSACANCPNKLDCVSGSASHRTVTRSEHTKIYEETDKRLQKNKDLYRRRQEIIEHPFGTIKHTMNGGYFLLRTRRKVRAEVALLFLGYNLKRALNVLGFEGIMAKLNILLHSFFRIFAKNGARNAFG